MLERLERLPIDPILGLMGLFRTDTDPRKVDLGVGVYRDDQGHTPILSCVRRAEQTVLSRQATKSYVGPTGNIGFNRAMEGLVLGEGHPALASDRVRSIQAPGGCGALRLGAELFRSAQPETVVHVSTPTWANHIPLVAQLVDDAMVRVEREGENDLRVAVDGGFLSVTEEGVSILAESAEFESEIDETAAKEDSESDDPRTAARGRARLRAVGALD